MKFTRRSLLAGSVAVAGGRWITPSWAAPAETPSMPVAGINLAGAEFGKLPGKNGHEYQYPGAKHIDYYRGLGFGLIRLPFKWERLQPQLSAPFDAGEWARLAAVVEKATAAGMQVVLDPHNYAKRRIADDGWSKEHGIGSDAVPTEAFLDFWARLAAPYRDNDRVVLGLMNEPVAVKVEPWLEIVNRTIAAIRGTGTRNLILVPGIEYSGAHSWLRLRNTVMAGVVDPGGRFAFDVHQYFDPDSSGTKPDTVSGTIGSERIEAFQAWAREHGFKAVLGEFNGPRTPAGLNALHDLCQEMSANPDVWLGWAAWAGGPRWPEKEMFTLEPWRDGRIREQTAVLAHYAKPSSADYWVSSGAVLDLDLARGRSFGASVDTTPKPKGLALDAPAAMPQAVSELMQRDQFTLVVETRNLPATQQALVLLAGGLVRRMPDGAIEAVGLRTDPQPLRNWSMKRRVALSVDRAGGRVAIGATGAKAVAGEARVDVPREVTAGGAGGALCRVTGYADFRPPEGLDGMLA